MDFWLSWQRVSDYRMTRYGAGRAGFQKRISPNRVLTDYYIEF
jgi:hypothetical protein